MAYPPPVSEPVAIVGSSCRFAGGVTSPQKLSSLLSDPSDLSRPVPPARFSAEGFSLHDAGPPGKASPVRGYWLDQDHRAFDANFFNIPPKEAEAIDPQQRMLLEVTYEALESAGYTQQHYAGDDVAVYVGVMTCDYETLSARDDLNTSQYVATGNARSMLSSRLSYAFDFRGPSMTLDTACSSSLVALHQGVQSVRSGESVMACVAGVNLLLAPEQFVAESHLNMLSTTGRCRMWDARADGYARGEGVVSLFLKTLGRALADGDDVQAVIRETGVSSDGRTSGLTVPSSAAQRRLIRSTYSRSGLDPADPRHRPQFFEAHGTGTPVGDPLEARAISEAFFGEDPSAVEACGQPEGSGSSIFVGSVKTVIGHTEGAAGLAGLLKTVQAMAEEAIFPNLHLDSPNPDLLSFCGRLQVPVEKRFWLPAEGQPRRASVNSFGFGGTNAHAIVEQYQPDIHNMYARTLTSKLPPCGLVGSPGTTPHVPQMPKDSKITLPLLLSADSQKSLHSTLVQYRDVLLRDGGPSYEQLCWHLYNNRTAHRIRVAVIADDRMEASRAISSMVDAGKPLSVPDVDSQIGSRPRRLTGNPNILGIFTGQGAQYAAMSSGLLGLSSVYRDTIKSLDDILQNCPDPPAWSIQDQLLASRDDSQLGGAALSQPVCTAVQIALVEFLRSMGVRFRCVVGHSSGEIAAAYAAGRLGRRDAMLVAYYRGRRARPASGARRGGMLACGLTRADAEGLCARPAYGGRIEVAASNAPTLVTLSGDLDALAGALAELRRRGVFARLLDVDTAYHSFHMRRAVEAYSDDLSRNGINVSAADANTTWISSVYPCGAWREIPGEELCVQYWADNMIKPVLFHEAVRSALEQCGPFHCAVEVGPHAALKSSVRETMEKHRVPAIPYVSVLDRTKPDHLAIADLLGTMWTNFDPPLVDVRSYVENSPASRLVHARLRRGEAPTYPWDHSKIHWRESRLSEQYHFRRRRPHELLGVRARDDNQHEMRWRNILKLDKLPWLEGHKFQGQPLLPASAYCIMALDAARALVDESPGRVPALVELRDLEFLHGITVEADSLGTEILFTLRLLSSEKAMDGRGPTGEATAVEAEFTLTSVPVKSFGFSKMRKNLTGKMRIVLEGPHFVSLPRRRSGPRAETISVAGDAFYRMMNGIGLDYSGPFMALDSIQRGPSFATSTLARRHGADTTSLLVSPATLDSCFQATFAAFSSPGDGALWTCFLPTKIAAIRFTLETGGSSRNDSNISVESKLTQFQPYSGTSATTITSDISIFNAQGDMEIQVEDFTVSSFAPTKPEDDYELYLHTVLDVDPESEIIAASPFSSMEPDQNALESCERVADHFAKHTGRDIMTILDTPPASPVVSNLPDQEDVPEGHPSSAATRWEKESALRRFVHTSPYFSTLNFLRSVGETNPAALPNILPSAIREAQQMLGFQKHLGRIVQQIAHRYPRMNILGLTDPKFTCTEHILEGLQDAYRSYNIGRGVEANLHDRLPSLRANKKVSFDRFSLDRAEKQGDVRCDLYDLVLLSVSVCGEDTLSRVSALKMIRKVVKSGGFLILIHMPPTPLRRQSKIFTTPDQTPPSPVTPPGWPDWLGSLTECGFVSGPRNSDQHHPLGFSLSIRRADGRLAGDTTSPQGDPPTTEHLLLVGGQTERVRTLARELAALLAPGCTRVSTAPDPAAVPPAAAAACTAAVLLTDLEAPVCGGMTARRLAGLQALARPGLALLWVTAGARADPDRAASLGLARTWRAEVPGLALRVLDLEGGGEEGAPVPAAVVARELRSLLLLLPLGQGARRDDDDDDDEGARLGAHEDEVHVVDGRRMIPRVLPYRPANARLNAYRRPVSTMVNTLDTCVRLEAMRTGHGATAYRAHSLGGAGPEGLEVRPPARLMYVEYSSSSPVSIGQSEGMYVCVGRMAGRPRLLSAALSSELASIVHVHHLLTYDLSTSDLDPSDVASILFQVLSAFELVGGTQSRNLVLIEPDQTLLRCVRTLVSDAFAEKRISLQAWSCDEKSCQNSEAVFRHPWSTAREVRNHLPDDCVVHDFLPEGSQLTRTLAVLGNKSHVQYHRGFGDRSSAGKALRWDRIPDDDLRATWRRALELSLHEMATRPSKRDRSSFVTPTELLDATLLTPSSPVIDWKADRNLRIEVRPMPSVSQFLRGDRTYLLVGLTRDLGQSLCRFFIDHGARNIIVASRNPDTSAAWVAELNTARARVHVSRLDVAVREEVRRLRDDLDAGRLGMPRAGGVVNGAMVLDDRVFAQMDAATWARVLRPKAAGSRHLDAVFGPGDLDFLVLTSSFAAVGGHAGQANYAAANMYMNGLAAARRRRGGAASVLNMGVVHGLGLLARAGPRAYRGLARDGYPPLSERDVHHMFAEAIAAGRRGGDGGDGGDGGGGGGGGGGADLTTGLARFRAGAADPLHWHRDRRFCHHTVRGDGDDGRGPRRDEGPRQPSIGERLGRVRCVGAAVDVFRGPLCRRVEIILQSPAGSVDGDSRIAEIGIDSLAAVEIRNWFYKSLGQDVPVMKILGASCLSQLCHDVAEKLISGRNIDDEC